mgnify:CR=1 FL=1
MTDIFAKIITRQNDNFNLHMWHVGLLKNKLNTNFTIDQILKFVFIQSIVNGGNKFTVLEEQFINNKFLIPKNLDVILEVLSNAQKTYHTLARFVNKIAYERARVYDYNMDMAMVPLSEYKPHMLITLLENNTKYNFKLGDLITLIRKRLCHSSNFFPDPLDIVNPYTNIPLSFRNLYKIYFKCKSSNYKLPSLFHQFFLCNFNVNLFLDYNECLLKEHIIDDYVKTATERQKNKKLAGMVYHYRNYIDYRNFNQNKEEIYKKVSHLLTYYLRSKYSLNPNVRFNSKRIIQNELSKLVCPQSHPFKKNRSRTIYRHIAPDIDRYNPFVFGPLNETVSDNETDSETDIDEEMDDAVSDNVSETGDSDELTEIQMNNTDASFNIIVDAARDFDSILDTDHVSDESTSYNAQDFQTYVDVINSNVVNDMIHDILSEEQ